MPSRHCLVPSNTTNVCLANTVFFYCWAIETFLLFLATRIVKKMNSLNSKLESTSNCLTTTSFSGKSQKIGEI